MITLIPWSGGLKTEADRFGDLDLEPILDPTTYVGLAPALVDRALAQTKQEGWLD